MKTGPFAVFLLVFSCLFTSAATGLSPTAAADDAPPGYRLLIYYGIPKAVNHVWDENRAAEIFAQYDVLVFGENLEEPTHPHHHSTQHVLSFARRIEPHIRVYGYVDLGVTTVNHSMAALKDKVRKWKALGADGIFLDDAGFDYGVSRARLNETVRYVHELGLSAFINAWDPDDVMGSAVHPLYNPNGAATALDRRDIYLLEDFLLPTDINAGNSPSAFHPSFREKMDASLRYRTQLGVKLMSVSSIDYTRYTPLALRKFFRLNEVTAGVFSLDAYGIAPLHYSADERGRDEVRFFPYITNYWDYYTTNITYIAKYHNRDFSRGGFRIHSLPGDHYYLFPETVRY